LRTHHSFQNTVTDRLEVREDHGDPDEVSLRRTYGKENADAAVLQPVLITG
jgi:hypothetical protein